MNIYVATSWKNQDQPWIVSELKKMGHEVYDFRHPSHNNNGFHWMSIDRGYQNWTIEDYIQVYDMNALEACEICLLILPCGKSAHLELGWAAGRDKITIILMDEDYQPELIYKMASFICKSFDEVKDVIYMISQKKFAFQIRDM